MGFSPEGKYIIDYKLSFMLSFLLGKLRGLAVMERYSDTSVDEEHMLLQRDGFSSRQSNIQIIYKKQVAALNAAEG